ncbi:carbamoyltransferase HypF [Sulfurimonas sp.]|uniref:carbamoyltransferase HypF n=1 Tax=Sulfurimonas sp. TaxID=2022749 RepID=UPI002AAF2D39|nr:carbamoyltransferase HypF [Sulfurimonas sp.]
MQIKRVKFEIFGQVQGVGFRPFIYKLVTQLSLKGFVKNNQNGVELEVEGLDANISKFETLLHSELPPLARIDKLQKTEKKQKNYTTFEIIQSTNTLDATSKTALISPDIATCSECLNDIKNTKKYLNYFATNCTNCGPRYSIIKTVPYDRVNTSMKRFTMCNSCKDEYKNPLNRRYHAQPISCNSCGPTLNESIKKTADNIKSGKIVAIKGIGGFHIICDANNSEVIKKLREFKHRPSKPFAIMCKDEEQVKEIASMSEKESELLTSKEAPIVILKKNIKNSGKYSKYIAPNIDRIACFLPYTSLHHLLFEHLENPIVATSANLANEPIIIDANMIKEKLSFVEFILDFDREIINGVDDSLLQVVDAKVQMLRLSRGFGPKVIKLPFKSKKKILAVGANAKNAIAFVIDDNIILSPHIGDLGSLKAFEFFQATIETFKRFYDFEPDIIVYDKHPNYETTSWAKQQDKELKEVQHHLAHIYATKAEFALDGNYLGFSFDGTGYGDDGLLWGGEIFLGDKRKYTFKSIKLLGGEKAIKEPRRVALSMLFDRYTLDKVLSLNLELVKSFKKSEVKILHQSYSKNLNAPKSSSVGRMFDAIASFSNLLHFQTYEGEAGLICEQNYKPEITKVFEYKVIDGVIEIEFDVFDKEIVSIYINTLCKIVLDISKQEKKDVILSGGVFQNKTLLELIIKDLKKENIKYYYQQETSINDGGIALGQAYYQVMQ